MKSKNKSSNSLRKNNNTLLWYTATASTIALLGLIAFVAWYFATNQTTKGSGNGGGGGGSEAPSKDTELVLYPWRLSAASEDLHIGHTTNGSTWDSVAKFRRDDTNKYNSFVVE